MAGASTLTRTGARAAALASLATRRARLIQAERGAEEGRWAPGSLRGKLGRAGTEPSLSGTEPPGVAGAPSSANSRSAGGSLASSLDAEAGGLPAYILNPVGSALARSTWGSGLYPATPSAGGRIATPFSVGSSASLAHAATSNPLHAGGADAAAGGGALTLRRADALSCSPASSGRSGGGGEGEDPAPGAGAWAGEPWRFGGAGGGELISFADLQFSRCIGQARCPRNPTVLCSASLHGSGARDLSRLEAQLRRPKKTPWRLGEASRRV